MFILTFYLILNIFYQGKRRDTHTTSRFDRQWSDAIARWGTQYYVCQLVCDTGYQLKDYSFNKVGCRMSDNFWVKPYIEHKHYW